MDEEARVKGAMQDIARAVHRRIPRDHGFFVMVYPFGDSKLRSHFVSNGNRQQIIATMKEFIIRNGSDEEWMNNID